MVINVNLGTYAITGLGYQFFDKNEQPIGSKITTGIISGAPGRYTADASFPTGATSVRWTTDDPAIHAEEYFDPRLPNITTGAAGAVATHAPADILDLANGIESNITLRQALRAILSLAVGKGTGGGTTTLTFRNVPDTTNRVVMTVDGNGNRSSVTLNLS